MNVTVHVTGGKKADGKSEEVSILLQSKKNMRQMVIC